MNRKKLEFFLALLNNKDNMETKLVKNNAIDIDRDIHASGHGALIFITDGKATLHVNFDAWETAAPAVAIIFPGDVVSWSNVTDDYSSTVLRYSSDVLRAASLNIEQAVYDRLREDRICSAPEIIENIMRPLFKLFGFYYGSNEFTDTDRITALQLQSLFLGFHDYNNFHGKTENNHETSRTRQLFSKFMQLLDDNYLKQRDVQFYTEKMNISGKYLGNITRRQTGLSPKNIIDEFIMLHLRLRLRDHSLSMKQISRQFNFPDQAALTRYFKLHAGITPKAYRLSEKNKK